MMEKRVLIVDDDTGLRDNLTDILRDEGYYPFSAASCSEALTLVQEQKPGAALLDLKLPDRPGTALLADLKQDYPDCICIIITAYADLDSALTALEQGAFQYLQKPVRPLELLRVLDRVFDTIRLRDEKRSAEQRLKESEEQFREMAELLPETIYEMDSRLRLIFVNRGGFEQFGYALEDFDKGLNALDMLIPEDRERALEAMGRIQRGEKGWLNEYTALRKDGTTFPVLIRSNPIMRDGSPAGIRGLIIDISDKKRLETQLLQAQKMKAIGTLAGGIAHDFNNILMGVQGRTSLMLADTPADHPHHEHLTSIEEYVKSASELTKQLLGFAKGGKYQVKTVDLNKLVIECSTLFGRTKKEIRIHRKLPGGLWTVEADRAQIEQVLLNLFVNAWQAMPGGGDLFLQTENVCLTEQGVAPHDVKGGEYVRISVADTGTGMDEVTQNRIFDPFFTTKEMGRGTGLGLASAYGILRNHGGFIEVSSGPGKGSTFQIYLPASKKEILPEEQGREDLLKGEETVLLVDDEPMIIDVGKEMMQGLGYRVLVARSGKEAVKIYKDNEHIELVILDLIMPGMGGGEVYDRLKEINPDLKVLLSSGYSIEGEAKEIMARGSDGFIQKPFNIHEISQKIREILEK